MHFNADLLEDSVPRINNRPCFSFQHIPVLPPSNPTLASVARYGFDRMDPRATGFLAVVSPNNHVPACVSSKKQIGKGSEQVTSGECRQENLQDTSGAEFLRPPPGPTRFPNYIRSFFLVLVVSNI